ncbi:hypothetical protein Csa_020130, partial [Cucumis sativus]
MAVKELCNATYGVAIFDAGTSCCRVCVRGRFVTMSQDHTRSDLYSPLKPLEC